MTTARLDGKFTIRLSDGYRVEWNPHTIAWDIHGPDGWLGAIQPADEPPGMVIS